MKLIKTFGALFALLILSALWLNAQAQVQPGRMPMAEWAETLPLSSKARDSVIITWDSWVPDDSVRVTILGYDTTSVVDGKVTAEPVATFTENLWIQAMEVRSIKVPKSHRYYFIVQPFDEGGGETLAMISFWIHLVGAVDFTPSNLVRTQSIQIE